MNGKQTVVVRFIIFKTYATREVFFILGINTIKNNQKQIRAR